MTQESTNNTNDERVKAAMDNLSDSQSYQSFVSLFPHLAKSGLATQIPSAIPLMFKKGEGNTEVEEEQEEIIEAPVIIREGEKVQEESLDHGQTVFSLDNQDAKLLVDNFMSEDATEYSMDNYLPNSTINALNPLSSYSPSSYTPSVYHVDGKIIGEKENDTETEENSVVNWDGGFTKLNKNTTATKIIIDTELIMESFDDDDEDEIVEVQNIENGILTETSSTQPIAIVSNEDAEYIEVEKFSIDEDFDYDNIILARKYSPETERKLFGRFNEFEEQLSKLNVNKN